MEAILSFYFHVPESESHIKGPICARNQVFDLSIENSFWIWDFNREWLLICHSYWNPALNKFICITAENSTIPWKIFMKSVYYELLDWLVIISLASLFTSFKWSTFTMQKYTEAEYDNIPPYTKTCHFDALYKMVWYNKINANRSKMD
jgi:hypothetical protein